MLRHLRLFVCIIVGGIGGAACSSSTRPSSANTTVRVCWRRDPESLNPVALPNANAVQIVNFLYQGLLVVDGPQRRYMPCLAESLPEQTRTDSATLFTYNLRPQASWDNGRPVTANDVLFTLKVLNCPGLPNERLRSAVNFIRDIRTELSYPRRFTLVCDGYSPESLTNSGEFPILPEYLMDAAGLLQAVPLRELTRGPLSPASQAAIEKFAQQFNSPARWHDPQQLRGSGPYTLASWQSGQRLVLRRKAHWWADELQAPPQNLQAHPAKLEFHIIPDPATALLALRRGNVDVYPNMPAADFHRLRLSAQAQRFNFFAPPSYRMAVLEFNTRRPALRQAATRRALAHLLDVPTLLRVANLESAQRSVSFVSPREKWAYYDSLPLIAYNTQQADTLLAQAGWQRTPQGWMSRTKASASPQKLKLQLYYRAGERTMETAALLLRQAASQLDIPIELNPTEASQFSEVRHDGQFDLNMRMLYGNPFSYDLRPLLHTGSIGVKGGNSSGFGTPTSDELLEAVVMAQDTAQKIHTLHSLQKLLWQEAPIAVLYFEPNFLAVDKRFTNVRPSGPEPGYDLSAFRLAASK